MKIHSTDVRNVINNLVDLQECALAGKDYCAVADIANGIEYLEIFYAALYGAEKMMEEKADK